MTSIRQNVKDIAWLFILTLLYPFMILVILIALVIEICELSIISLCHFYKFKNRFHSMVSECVKEHQNYDIHITSLACGCSKINNILSALKNAININNFPNESFADEMNTSVNTMIVDMSSVSSRLSYICNLLKDDKEAIVNNVEKIKEFKVLFEKIVKESSLFLNTCNANDSILNGSVMCKRINIVYNLVRVVQYVGKFCLTHVEHILKNHTENIESSVPDQYICEDSTSVIKERSR